jgi:hypothetical protein
LVFNELQKLPLYHNSVAFASKKNLKIILAFSAQFYRIQKMKAKEYKAFKHFGPGGISCPCCTPFNSVKKNRQMVNRAFRRQSKKQIDSDL